MEIFRINIIPSFESTTHSEILTKLQRCETCRTPLQFHYKMDYEFYLVEEQPECPRCKTLGKTQTHMVH